MHSTCSTHIEVLMVVFTLVIARMKMLKVLEGAVVDTDNSVAA
jgi:hypothetical protein